MRYIVLRCAATMPSTNSAEHVSSAGYAQLETFKSRTSDLRLRVQAACVPLHTGAHQTALALCPSGFKDIYELAELGFVHDDEKLLYRELYRRFEHQSTLKYLEGDGSEWLLSWAARAARAVRDEVDQEARIGDYRADAGDVLVVCQNRLMVALVGALLYPQHAPAILTQPYGACEGFVADPRTLVQLRVG